MPIFDFACQDCGSKFDLMISNADKDKVTCPNCSSKNIKQLLSEFHTGKTRPSFSPGCSQGCSAAASGA
ncbi:MAG: zinc ribbon domain-containing protein [Syntrophomonadaceae bacterium]